MTASDDDEVGYRKPPKKSRFAPGQSGNPKGRPRAARSVGAEIHAELKRQMTIRENGKEKKVAKAVALAKQLVAHALADTRTVQQLVKLSPADFISPPDPATNARQPLDAKDAEILERFFAQRLRQAQSAMPTTTPNILRDEEE